MKDDNFTLPMALLTVFLGWQLFSTYTQAQKLNQTLGICQQREQRTNEMIDKLRGFNQ
ncbi:hypothetical protein NDI37_26820 [Funiculus sociatus GB2-A5]|uniref:Phage protein n=1 Tax=Funiculus sociatus GB2-A5 TaxID=2933946 RepID=A0ABV0JX65_9CYAN|nr:MULTISPECIES: hypothetical protein [unclassified Trichocoleus]MBD1907885.1 hypothetical protein [Trichocoleus sp. FACHB-832]MBD2064194.1 hypothetical protein [Trichocoleus sp. FACHB-6]